MTLNKYTNLSKDELYLISRTEFEKQRLITTAFAQKLFTNKNKASKVLTSLTRKGRLIQLEKGKYILVPIKAPNQQWTPNEFLVASLWMGDTAYYVGYFTMYNYWGFTEQVPQTVFVPNVEKSRTKIIGGVKYQAVKIDRKKYYGTEIITIDDQNVCISDKERTLVDFIYKPVGSREAIEEVLKSNLKKIDVDKFIEYLCCFPVVSVRQRAGYYLAKFDWLKPRLRKLKRSIASRNTYVVLDPSSSSRKGAVNNDWRIIVNR
ncbi:MAG: type IV toxin-antitoxin system AbiEi family antitoxin [Candidatus Omnitrophota bacterium]